MINKALRIMIADAQHIRRLRLERDINHQGYYAIAPVSSREQMLDLLGYGERGFDLLLVNAQLVIRERFDLRDFLRDLASRVQVLVYDVPACRLAMLSAEALRHVVFSPAPWPEGGPVRALLSKVDPSRLSVVA
ncbi:hypothetical protein C4J93_3113 [Pseudomonas sp. R2-37-08W]|uniref:response regulator n=1 Tax=Pseudomonas sp. R2-37-08W TaxID=1173273 RepID=UPI000F56412A|nr:response regulator [Pseudomonas sp. R2-37-08W]AZF11309.1 hypothetical protein C4J93_3113 [Pseudomonas sp. R2-37-08W]